MTTAYLHPALIGGRVYLAPLTAPATSIDGQATLPSVSATSSASSISASGAAQTTLQRTSAAASVGTISASGTSNPLAKVSLRLVDPSNAPRANLVGLRWAFFDQGTPDAFAAPVAKGQGATTDANGVFSATLAGSSLSPGAIGWLIVSDSAGGITQVPPAKAFSGPVAVS